MLIALLTCACDPAVCPTPGPCRTTGELTMQLQADVGNIKDSVTSHLPELVQHVLTLAGGL